MMSSFAARCMTCGGLMRCTLSPSLPHRTTQNLPFSRGLAYRARKSTTNAYSKKEYPENPLVNYWRSLKWVPIPLGVGFAYIGYQQFGHVIKREEKKLQHTPAEELVATDWVVHLYKCLPLKILSRVWGRINSVELPMWMRQPVYKTYIKAFGCKLEEAAIQDLQHYRNLGEFFRRRLRPGVRPVAEEVDVVCPSDGVVLTCGESDGGVIEQVKGISYSMQDFLGPPTWPKDTDKTPETSLSDYQPRSIDHLPTKMGLPAYEKSVKKNDGSTKIYQCVIYLAPGDYHGFHSPAQWTITQRRHFPGELFSVNPSIARMVKGLFNFNERAVYIGIWQYGFFSMAAVGATNVGSINVFHDQELDTNQPFRYAQGSFFDLIFQNSDMGGIEMKKGEAFGEFNLGSTIVVVFEAPVNFKFKVEPGQKVKVGQPLGTTEESR